MKNSHFMYLFLAPSYNRLSTHSLSLAPNDVRFALEKWTNDGTYVNVLQSSVWHGHGGVGVCEWRRRDRILIPSTHCLCMLYAHTPNVNLLNTFPLSVSLSLVKIISPNINIISTLFVRGIYQRIHIFRFCHLYHWLRRQRQRQRESVCGSGARRCFQCLL